jgi:hypothetical protein
MVLDQINQQLTFSSSPSLLAYTMCYFCFAVCWMASFGKCVHAADYTKVKCFNQQKLSRRDALFPFSFVYFEMVECSDDGHGDEPTT